MKWKAPQFHVVPEAADSTLTEVSTAPALSRLALFQVATVHAVQQGVANAVRPEASSALLMSLHALSVLTALFRPRLAMVATAALTLIACAREFPRTANHLFLGVVFSLLLALNRDDDPQDRRLLRKVGLTLPLIAFFWSGVQKAWHGYWFDAQMLAYAMVARDDIAAVLTPFLDSDTLTQVSSLRRDLEGSGPFQLPLPWRLVSNGIWVFEVMVPLCVWWRGIRVHLWFMLLGATWLIQLVAHEGQFALLLSNMLLCAAPARVQPFGRAVLLLACSMAALAGPRFLEAV